MADILTRLLLKTDNFEANLNKAKGSVNSFQGNITSKTSIAKDGFDNLQGGISNMAKMAGSSFMKFAGTIGLAISAGEGLMKVMRSTQGTSDEFDNTLNSCKWTVDAFFQSLSSGDFSAFNDGILNTIESMKELSVLKDSLADAKLSMGYNVKTFDAQFSEYESIIRDATKSKKDRVDALKALQTLKDNFKIDINDTLKGSISTLLKEFNTKSGRNDFTINDIEDYISINNNDFSSRPQKKELLEYQSKLKELQSKQYVSQNIGGGIMAGSSYRIENKEITKQIQLLKEANKELEKQNWLNNDNDPSRIGMTQELDYIRDLKKREYDFDKRTLELQNSLKTGKNNDTPPPPIESISFIDSELSKLKKKLAEETTMQARASVQSTITELEQKKINLKLVIDQEVFKGKYGNLKDGELKMAGFNYADTKQLKKTKLPKRLPKVETPIHKEDIDLNEQYAESLMGIGSVMGNLSGLFDDNTASIVQWGANLFNTIAQAIPQIMKLAATDQIQANSARQSAAANTLDASSKAMKAHSGIPFVGVALGIASVAAIIASMMSVPNKFAFGGIVPGTSFTGDKVPALLNSGEMILNASQQSNMFRLLNSPRVGVNANLANIASLSGQSELHLTGDFKARGADLYLILDNYKKKTGKR